MLKVDFHTHSIMSHDGGISEKDYEKVFELGILDCLAITDHHEIHFAQKMQRRFGQKIIIGEEIMTQQGEVIGLFLKEKINKGFTLKEVVNKIKDQDGLVYIPHPLEIIRKGISLNALYQIQKDIDIIEVFNGRARFSGKNVLANKFAEKYNISKAASSDAHAYIGLGNTYTELEIYPTRLNLQDSLQNSSLMMRYSPLVSYLSPFLNRLKKRTKLIL